MTSDQLPSNKKFGFFFALIFFLVALYLNRTPNPVLIVIPISISTFFLVAALLCDSRLEPLNKLWMKLGLLLGMFVSPLAMCLIFFSLFTPIALLMKLLGRDELRIKMKPQDSHWRFREQSKIESGSFKYQF